MGPLCILEEFSPADIRFPHRFFFNNLISTFVICWDGWGYLCITYLISSNVLFCDWAFWPFAFSEVFAKDCRIWLQAKIPCRIFGFDYRQLEGFAWQASWGSAVLRTPDLAYGHCIAVSKRAVVKDSAPFPSLDQPAGNHSCIPNPGASFLKPPDQG